MSLLPFPSRRIARHGAAWLRRAAAVALLAGTAAARAQVPPAPVPGEAGCPPVAHAPSADEARAGLRDAVDRGFLWRIVRDGRTSTLYGTLHAARAEWMYPGPQVMQALRDADLVALEIDPLDPEMRRRTTAAMAPHPQQRLSGLLGMRLNLQRREACLPPPSRLTPIAPEVQAAGLALLAGRRDGFDPAYGIDNALAGLARSLGKPVVSLETPEAQLALVTGDPRRGRAMIDSLLAQLEDGTVRPMIRRLGSVWAEGRLDELADYASWCGCMKTADDRALARLMIDQRNVSMAERVAALHGEGRRVFVAVGSLHMVGAAGLPALLARRGFAVEKVAFPVR